MASLKTGDKAPDFTLSSGDGSTLSLTQFLDKKVVLYFYPADDTETCTKQACSFRDQYTEIKKLGGVVIGISPDSTASHFKFSMKHSLNFPILSDENKSTMKHYGVWKNKVLFGKKYMGVIRTTFIIDERGYISNIFHKVKVKGHLEKVREALKN